MPNALSNEKNTWAGTLHADFRSDHSFDQQYNTFQRFGYAHNPSAPLYNPDGTQNFVGNEQRAKENKGSLFILLYYCNDQCILMRSLIGITALDVKEHGKKKRIGSKDPKSDDFLGPWAPYEDDIVVSSDEEEVEKPEEDAEAGEAQIEATKPEIVEQAEEKPTERTILHKKERYDYLGRTYLSPPSGLKITEHDCYLPKKRIHTWSGHTKPVSTIKLFPKTGHLLLSADLDGKVKLWDVYNKRRVLRTFLGHSKGVKDVCFSEDGSQILTASLDNMVKLWDTESGEVIGRFDQECSPLCAKFYPEDCNQFLTGRYDKQIAQWDCRANEIVLVYDRHLGPVNSLTFVDDNRRFVSTSDDKSIRVWDWNTPVEIKYISEPYMHSMPCAAISASKKWVAFQSLDNQILIYGGNEKFKMNRRKQFRGHVVAGYACQPTFSADGKYIASGDSGGNFYVWDWKSQKIYKFVLFCFVSVVCLLI